MNSVTGVMGQLASVALVLGLLSAAVWWLRRRGFATFEGPGAKRARILEVMESRTIGPGQAIHVVRVADRVLVLAAHSAGCTLLETRPLQEIVK